MAQKMIEKKPFVKYSQEKSRDTVNVSFNQEERETLDKVKLIIEQAKDSTALKQLAFFGAKVLEEDKTRFLLATLFKNKRNNYRAGIVDFE